MKLTSNKNSNSPFARAAVKCVLLVFLAFAQIAAAQTVKSAAPVLSAAERALAEGSKAAIAAAGISPAYFERHFKLARVIDLPGDRRVVWTFKINEFETTLNDAVGFYTDAKQKRVDVHSVRSILSTAHNIEKTVTRKRADELMTQCIGKHTPGAVIFQSHGANGRAALLFTASQITEASSSKSKNGKDGESKREREEKRERETGRERQRTTNADTIESEDDEGERKPLVIAYVNLETGVCTKGYGISDYPKPNER